MTPAKLKHKNKDRVTTTLPPGGVKLSYYPWIFAALFSLLFLPCLPPRLAAQTLTEGFKKIPIDVNGIPFNQFVAIVQDREGFLWLSTGEELLKYDGYEAKVYRNNPKDSTSLGHPYVRKLYVDTQGELWAGHKKGLSRYKGN